MTRADAVGHALRHALGHAGPSVGAALIGAGCLGWAATPPAGQSWAGFALFLAIVGVAAGVLRLALADVPVPEDNYLLSVPLRTWFRFLDMLRLVPWEEGALVAILWLEVLHSMRPWHTAVLGAGLIAYLLTTHLAESAASPAALKPQAPALVIGAVLLALGAGAGMLPVLGPGAGSALMRLLAAAALIIAAGLVLPHVARSNAPDTALPPDREPSLRRRRQPEPPTFTQGSQIQPRNRR